MDDEWDLGEEMQLSQQSSAADSASDAESPKKKLKKSAGKKAVKKGHFKASPKKKPVSKARVLDKNCFICVNKKKSNSRFCLVHNPPAEAIKSQAVAKNELKAFEEVMYNKEKCTLAIEEFMRENPPGKFRKKLIDFGQWKKTMVSGPRSRSMRTRWSSAPTRGRSMPKTSKGWIRMMRAKSGRR